MIHSKITRASLSIAALLSLTSSLSAATIAHYRFESGSFLNDSSGNNFTLTNNGGTTELSVPTVSGDGSSFPSGQAAQFAANQSFSKSDESAFGVSDMTIEMYYNSDRAGAFRVLASQWNQSSGVNDRGWRFGLNNGNRLFFQFSQDGTSTINNHTSALTIDANTDYYIAAAVDFTGSGNDVTFYVQDLTNGGTLSSVVSSLGGTTLFNSSEDFRINAMNNNSISNDFEGIVDEVRWSNVALAQNELLISTIPEPSTYALVVASIGFLMVVRRKNLLK